jgi:hypothetical protein
MNMSASPMLATGERVREERVRTSEICEASLLYEGSLQYRSFQPGCQLSREQVVEYPDFESTVLLRATSPLLGGI